MSFCYQPVLERVKPFTYIWLLNVMGFIAELMIICMCHNVFTCMNSVSWPTKRINLNCNIILNMFIAMWFCTFSTCKLKFNLHVIYIYNTNVIYFTWNWCNIHLWYKCQLQDNWFDICAFIHEFQMKLQLDNPTVLK